MMKKATLLQLTGVVLLTLIVLISGCKKKEDDTVIKGSASFIAGVSGDLGNSKVSLYTTYDNWVYNQPIRYVAVSGSGANVTFEFTNVLPGNYYLDVWKDIDNSADWSSGDLVGWYGSGGLGSPNLTEFQITEGQTIEMNVDMYIIAKDDPLAK